ncbi:MAG: carbon storage regulator, partial [Planctomycetes bacterium]|nr:carbon storage regulator [Planctomycetota bacterium]
MLILARKRNEAIKVGDDVVIRVMRITRTHVKLGIEAPDSVRIVRGELSEFTDMAVSALDFEQDLEDSLTANDSMSADMIDENLDLE